MRIAVNAVSARPMRLEVVEAYVAGKPRNDETANAAGEIAVTGAVALAHNAYKIPMMRNLVKRAIRGGQRMGIDFCAMPAKAAIRPGVGGGCDNECSVTP